MECHDALNEIVSTRRLKQLLCQGTTNTKQLQLDPDIKLRIIANEKRRILPAHLHLNINEIEMVYLISAILLEMPQVLQ